MLHDQISIGCCGWGESKAKYVCRFPAVELQSTFYEPPSIALAAKWRAIVPPDFEYCIKAWQLVTHSSSSPTYRRLKLPLSPQELDQVGSFLPTEQVWLAWERTLDIAHALKASLILFQCPASFAPNAQNILNLRSFLTRIDRGTLLLALELRGTWSDGLIGDLCAEFTLLHCHDPLRTTPSFSRPAYWRLHGRSGYSYRYTDADLQELAALALRQIAASPDSLRIFFNNIWMKDDAARFNRLLQGTI